MRTTMDLPDGLTEQVRARANATGRTTTSLVEEALRLLLESEEVPARRGPLPTFGRRGGRFLVDVEDPEAPWSAMDADA